MTWGGFCTGKKLDLQFITTRETSSSYIQTLQTTIVPFFRNRLRSHVFQQDNASIHTNRATMAFLTSQRIKVLEWPACSPDLNPIKNLWGIMARRVYKNCTQYISIQDLKVALQAEWNKITDAELKNLVASMSNRMFESELNKAL
ncbi:unnamed protein product [Caenorhabditis nigoni]|uniref:Tc1-like transposase DDE domain-containing protein n=1 Tax=Caenorhabditis nigoni TaxID=1611254 RepID=A0A2G5SEN6_9PELO|nr:hypothetical protein B9Z55_027780 [Caenorhabditis nigoni]